MFSFLMLSLMRREVLLSVSRVWQADSFIPSAVIIISSLQLVLRTSHISLLLEMVGLGSRQILISMGSRQRSINKGKDTERKEEHAE
jgi:hypothetical protein